MILKKMANAGEFVLEREADFGIAPPFLRIGLRMAKRPKHPVELLSDIGSRVFELQHYGDEDIFNAMDFIRNANPEIFEFLSTVLNAKVSADISAVRHAAAAPEKG